MEKTKGEFYWVLAVRIIAFVIGFLPFIPNALWYIGKNPVKVPIDTSDMFFVGIGFIFLWGSGNFGLWANKLGKTLVNKLSKKD
tara:strand:- start:2476 stop:2727 length:252 start_codon:yes stop_codon:yes gene_type:complete